MWCAERGEKLSGGRYCCVRREGRNCAVGDIVVCGERGEIERWATVWCAERGENLSDGR